jgi:hypothetical protein
MEREREDRRKLFGAAYKAALRESRLRPMSEKEKLIALYMETHSVTEFWFYPDVSEDQLRTLAQEHFPDQGANGVMTLGALVTGNGVRSSLNGDANRGNSKGSSLLLASTSTKNLVKCPHWKHLAGNRDSCRNCKRHTTVTLWERRGHV